MFNFKTNLKYACSTVTFLTLFTSQASSHAIETDVTGMGHAVMAIDHCIPLILMGFLTAALMLTRKRLMVLAGNLGLLGYIIYQASFHATEQSFLPGFAFFMGAALVSLVSWRAVYLLIHASKWIQNRGKRLVHYYLTRIDNYLSFPKAKAHCDIPCKIYDPLIATVSALSVIRLIDIINETETTDAGSPAEYQNTIARCVQRKEEESEKLKQEIRIIWGDYFKEPQIASFPEIHDLTHKIMLLASAAKQKVDRQEALTLLEAVNKFSEIFWSTKDIETERKIAPYPPSLEVVRPK
jgi:nickel superoxide dismutase